MLATHNLKVSLLINLKVHLQQHNRITNESNINMKCVIKVLTLVLIGATVSVSDAHELRGYSASDSNLSSNIEDVAFDFEKEDYYDN